MHRALEIQEILSEIFRHLAPLVDSYHRENPDPILAALARTCRAFKEPALDVLWMALIDLVPLVRCLPEACCRSVSMGGSLVRWFQALVFALIKFLLYYAEQYGLSRPLTQAEWDILRSYTHRIRSIYGVKWTLDPKSYQLLSNLPIAGPLFPNLRNLHCLYSETTMPLLNLPLPSLVSLNVTFMDSNLIRNYPKAFLESSPNVRRLSVSIQNRSGTIEHCYMCRWQNLCSVDCSILPLDADTLVHLSRVPALTQLECTLIPTLPNFDPPLSFSNLRDLTLRSTSLNSISRLLSQSRLPALTDFRAWIRDGPSRLALSSLLTGLRTSNSGHTIKKLKLSQMHPSSDHVRSEALLLNLEYLQSHFTFSNLSQLDICIECNVYLTDGDLLTLASTWPKLETFRINAGWGWNSQSGITPGGLVRLMEMCRSLDDVALRLDTRGYTRVAPNHARAHLELTYPRYLRIDVLDSAIEAESVPALIDFLSGIKACCGSNCFLRFNGWDSRLMLQLPNAEVHAGRWCRVLESVYGSGSAFDFEFLRLY